MAYPLLLMEPNAQRGVPIGRLPRLAQEAEGAGGHLSKQIDCDEPLRRRLHFIATRQHYHQSNSRLNAKHSIDGVPVNFDRAFAYTEFVSDQPIRKASTH
jgi:hypothetical protein